MSGLYRTGKSFLLNALSSHDEGEEETKEPMQKFDENFRVDAKVEACTRGFWILADPITIEKDGNIIDVYFMDSEGLGGIDKH